MNEVGWTLFGSVSAVLIMAAFSIAATQPPQTIDTVEVLDSTGHVTLCAYPAPPVPSVGDAVKCDSSGKIVKGDVLFVGWDYTTGVALVYLDTD